MFDKIRNFIKFWKYNTHPSRMEFKSRKVALFGANKAFQLFKDESFGKLMFFDKKDEEERNRIFNELTVTNLVFLMLLLEQIVRETEDEDAKEYFRALRTTAPEYFKNFIRRIGIPEQYATLWDGLIDMRYNEYVAETKEMREEFFKQDDESLREYALDNKIMLFQTIVLGLYGHLVRGKIKKDDPLYKYLQLYLLQIHKGYLKRI